LIAVFLAAGAAKQGGFMATMKVTPATMGVALLVAALVGFISAVVPSYHASQVNIVEGLRHIG
jgi:ABC-type antimicrobial peptide transport system permease subunit